MKPLNRLEPIGYNPAKAAAAMRSHGLGAILLTSPENVYYTTGYTTLPSAGNPILYMLRNRLPFFAFLDREGEVTLLCWAFSTWDMSFGVGRVVGFNNFEEALLAIRDVLADNGSGEPIGVESTCPFYVLQEVQRATGGSVPSVADAVMEDLRLIKSEVELECLQRSLSIIEQTCGELYDALRLGMGRNELTHEAKSRLIRNGADAISHLTFSFGEANPEFDIDETLKANRLVTLDLGGIYSGYCSDNRRYAFTGPVPAELGERYGQMVTIVDEVGSSLLPGTPYADLMKLARSLYRQHGMEPLGRFNHVGHNIGLETEERWLDDDSAATVQPGMVINIELYTSTSTGEQIGNEETFVIGADGPTRTSRLPREIRVIG